MFDIEKIHEIQKIYDKKSYKNGIDELCSEFKLDLRTLIEALDLYTNEKERLIKYYYEKDLMPTPDLILVICDYYKKNPYIFLNPLGLFIYNMREKRKINRETFAKMLDLPGSSIMRYEKGETLPEIKSIQKIAKFFEVTLDEILEYKNENMFK